MYWTHLCKKQSEIFLNVSLIMDLLHIFLCVVVIQIEEKTTKWSATTKRQTTQKTEMNSDTRKGSQFLSETFIINSLLNEKDLLPRTTYGPLYVISNVASSDINQIGFPFSYTTCTVNQTDGILVCPLLITGINKHRGLCCFNN